MTEITLESITKKLGFDPMNPPYPEVEPQVVNDNRPSIWAPLTEEELAFLIEIDTGINFLVIRQKETKKGTLEGEYTHGHTSD